MQTLSYHHFYLSPRDASYYHKKEVTEHNTDQLLTTGK
jgi:hypothetical protein